MFVFYIYFFRPTSQTSLKLKYIAARFWKIRIGLSIQLLGPNYSRQNFGLNLTEKLVLIMAELLVNGFSFSPKKCLTLTMDFSNIPQCKKLHCKCSVRILWFYLMFYVCVSTGTTTRFRSIRCLDFVLRTIFLISSLLVEWPEWQSIMGNCWMVGVLCSKSYSRYTSFLHAFFFC